MKAGNEYIAKVGRKYYTPNYMPREVAFVRGEGSVLFDANGSDYVDFGSGIAVNSLGYSDADLQNAVIEQAPKVWHTSNIFFNEPSVMLAQELVDASGFAHNVFFCNSGAEANEAAIKLARKYASIRYPKQKKKREIITFSGSFHGRTYAAMTATAQPKYQEGFEPLPGGFKYCDKFNNIAALKKLINDNTCAVMLEPVQGEGGVTPCREKFLKEVRKLCNKHGALLILDEVQCGMMRTGTLFAHTQDDVKPDIVTLAKALGCGVPIGAMLANEKCASAFSFGSHGTTFGGNALACNVARVALHKLSSKEIEKNVKARSKEMFSALEKMNNLHKIFKEIRGRGLMIGAELNKKYEGHAADICNLARDRGLIVLVAGPSVLRFLPPLVVTSDELKEGMRRLRKALSDFLKES